MRPNLWSVANISLLAECDPTPSRRDVEMLIEVRRAEAFRMPHEDAQRLLCWVWGSIRTKTSYVALAGSITCVLIEGGFDGCSDWD